MDRATSHCHVLFPRSLGAEGTTVLQRGGSRGEGIRKSPLGRGGRRPGWVSPGRLACPNPPRRFAAPLQGGDGTAPVLAFAKLSCREPLGGEGWGEG